MAATYLLPYLLRPYRGAARPPDGDCLLSEANFQRELVPYLAMVLRIRDLPVRCALLEHFPAYCHLLDWAGAQRSLIPELLLGLRDRHDRLVARTHLAVAALLPLAGYAALFGDKADAARQSLFTDAQPRRRLLGAAPGDPADQLGTAGASSCGAGSAPLPLRDLAALSDRYRGPEEAAASEARRQAAMVEAESARILADRHRLKSAAQDDNSRLATVAEEPPPVATLSDPDDDDADWGNEWESDGMAGGGGSDAGNAGDVEIAASDSQPAPAPSKQPPPSSSQTAGLNGRGADHQAGGDRRRPADRRISGRTGAQHPRCVIFGVEQQQQQTTPSAALALAMAEGEVGEADAADGWSDDGDAWGLDEEVDDDEDASAAGSRPVQRRRRRGPAACGN
uniref:Rab-GAP TBC domain-containing protein n=1 Tax=Macrostomum lignano TaxID=282301 RepID=A0A1I8HHW1_9PLAT